MATIGERLFEEPEYWLGGREIIHHCIEGDLTFGGENGDVAEEFLPAQREACPDIAFGNIRVAQVHSKTPSGLVQMKSQSPRCWRTFIRMGDFIWRQW